MQGGRPRATNDNGRSGERRLQLVSSAIVISVAVAAWLAFFALMRDGMNPSMSRLSTDGSLPIVSLADMFSFLQVGKVSSFILIWVVGIVAMMFPAMVPIVATYARLVAKSEERPALALYFGTTLFLGGYVAIYALLGLLVFSALFAVFYLGSVAPSVWVYTLPATGIILLATGIWQLTSLKDRCLSNCVSPIVFFMLNMKRGLTGAFRMGTKHGIYCVGCCYMYMIVMVGVSAMSMLSMLLLTFLIIVEKAIVHGATWFRWLSASIFIFLGSSLMLFPSFFGFG